MPYYNIHYIVQRYGYKKGAPNSKYRSIATYASHSNLWHESKSEGLKDPGEVARLLVPTPTVCHEGAHYLTFQYGERLKVNPLQSSVQT